MNGVPEMQWGRRVRQTLPAPGNPLLTQEPPLHILTAPVFIPTPEPSTADPAYAEWSDNFRGTPPDRYHDEPPALTDAEMYEPTPEDWRALAELERNESLERQCQASRELDLYERGLAHDTTHDGRVTDEDVVTATGCCG